MTYLIGYMINGYVNDNWNSRVVGWNKCTKTSLKVNSV